MRVNVPAPPPQATDPQKAIRRNPRLQIFAGGFLAKNTDFQHYPS
jgi:hypothetical protein